jgi:hypothetical protein
MNLIDYGEKIYDKFVEYEIWVITNVPQFVLDIQHYNYNQELNEKHIADLAKQINTSKLIIGNISTCHCKTTGTLILIDGHHRVSALKKVLEESLYGREIISNTPLVVFNYHSDSPDSMRTMELFHKINTVKPYTVVKSIDKDCLYIINELKNKNSGFRQGLRDTNRTSANFPYVLQSKFKCALEEKLKTLGNYDRDTIITKLIEYNNSLNDIASTDDCAELFDKKTNPDVINKRIDTMKKMGFYLACDKGKLWPDKLNG